MAKGSSGKRTGSAGALVIPKRAMAARSSRSEAGPADTAAAIPSNTRDAATVLVSPSAVAATTPERKVAITKVRR